MTTAHRTLLGSAAVLVVGLGLYVFAADPPAPAVEAKADAKQADPLRPKDKDDALFAANVCAKCHDADPANSKDHVFARKHGSDQFILLSEGTTWERHDPHSKAFTMLKKERGQKMGQSLQYRNTDPKTWTDCLTCHAVDLSAGDTLSAGFKPDDRFATAEGVACVACHGVKKGWQSKHCEEPKDSQGKIPWRDWPAATKQNEYGLRDLRNPVVKATLCASCHVGSAELGRVVTHEMYAAGHPTLPPFELATFLEGEPKHWEHPSRLPYFDKVDSKDLWAKFHFHPKTAESAAAREFAVGAIAAVRAEAALMLADAVAAKDGGLDFARFDCVSCHHDLKTPSDRQKRGYDGPPGRPPLRASVGIPAAVVAKHAKESGIAELQAKAGGFEERWTALRKAATDKPFGDPGAVKKAAADVVTWCNAFLDFQSTHPTALYTPEQAKKLREGIADAALNEGSADPEAAMALAWAHVTLAREAGELSEEKATAFEKVLPQTVRAKPDPRATTPTPLAFGDRQRLVNKFTTDEFTKAFEALTKPK